MVKPIQKRIWILLALVLLLTACGRKEAPQIVHDGPAPQLIDLHHALQGRVLKLDFSLAGNPAGVGYQVDRAKIDPYCQCPGFWRRYLEVQPVSRNLGVPITKLLKLRSTTTEHVFRIRAFDVTGQLGPWSKQMRALGVDVFNK